MHQASGVNHLFRDTVGGSAVRSALRCGVGCCLGNRIPLVRAHPSLRSEFESYGQSQQYHHTYTVTWLLPKCV